MNVELYKYFQQANDGWYFHKSYFATLKQLILLKHGVQIGYCIKHTPKGDEYYLAYTLNGNYHKLPLPNNKIYSGLPVHSYCYYKEATLESTRDERYKALLILAAWFDDGMFTDLLKDTFVLDFYFKFQKEIDAFRERKAA